MLLPLQTYFSNHPGLQDLMAALDARLVGGTVRDLFEGATPHDIDLATPWLPDRVEAWLRQRGIWVHSHGAAFGTVTGRLLGGALLECTTLREDGATDGRRAVVHYTVDWEKDAHRRDFTCNSLSADAEGRLFDYTGGWEDLAQRRVRFIGDPRHRIAEDRLRLWRYLRFLGRWPESTVDRPSYEAVCREAGCVRSLSATRTRLEMERILPIVAGGRLVDEPVTHALFGALGRGLILERLPLLGDGFGDLALDWEDYWMALMRDEGEAADWLVYWGRNQRHQARWREAMACAMHPPTADAAYDLADRLGLAWMLRYLRQSMLRHGVDRGGYDAWSRMARPVFPVTGGMLRRLGFEGPELGSTLALLRERWRRYHGHLDLSTLLQQLDPPTSQREGLRVGFFS